MPLFLTNMDLINASQKYNIPLNGVYSKDQIPNDLKQGGYIINMENSHDTGGRALGGSHWVSFWIDPPKRKNGRPQVSYFDPFGTSPPLEVQQALQRYIPYSYSKVQIQSVSTGICGYYCLYFIWYMNHHHSIQHHQRFINFIKLFNLKDPTKNRKILDELLKNSFK